MKLLTLLLLTPLALPAAENSPYFQIHGTKVTDSFPLKDSHAEVRITGPIAEVTLTQTYTNLGNELIDATYIFPTSTQAAVHGMTMTIGERTLTAEIHKKEVARKKFEEAKKAKKSASLLTQHHPNIFSMEVARILPGDELKLSLRYSEILRPQDSEYEFVIPTAIGPRYDSKTKKENGAANPFLGRGEKTATRFSATLKINSPLPIKSLSCPSHTSASPKFSSKTTATLRLPSTRPDRDFIVRYRLADKKIQSGLLTHQSPEENTFLLQLEPPTRVTKDQIPPRDFIFVVDVSGSMTGFPLNLAKNLFRELTGTLRVLFAGANEVLAKKSLPATSANVKRAINFLDRRRGSGGTELRRALKTALDLPNDRDHARSLVLISDGFISAETKVFDLIREKAKGTNIFPLGVGSSVNRHLMKGLSHVAGRDEVIVTHSSETEKAKKRFLATISTPVLTNIRLSAKGVSLKELQPSLQPDLFANRPLSIVGQWTGKGPGTITLKATQGDGATFTKSFPINNDEQNPTLPTLWAREKVRALADYSNLTKNTELIETVTDLGLKYQLLTPYTSFVAVTDEPRENKEEATSIAQANPTPKGMKKSSKKSYTTHGSVPEPSSSLLMILTATILCFLRIRH